MAYHYLWLEVFMVHLIVVWFVSALALWIVAQIIPGIRVRDFGSALIAAAVIAVVNAIAGPVLKFFTFPLILLTLGLFLFVVNALLLKLAAVFTPGFEVHGFWAAVFGSIVLTLLNSILRHVVFSSPGLEWTSF
jgi:putative membrane protein